MIKHWGEFIKPTLLAYFLSALKVPWRKDFYKYIVEKKIVAVMDIDWNEVRQKWPFTTKTQIQSIISSSFQGRHGPLYETVQEMLPNLALTERNHVLKKKLAFIDAFEKHFA